MWLDKFGGQLRHQNAELVEEEEEEDGDEDQEDKKPMCIEKLCAD